MSSEASLICKSCMGREDTLLGFIFRTQEWASSDQLLVAQLPGGQPEDPFIISEGLGNTGRENLSQSNIVLKQMSKSQWLDAFRAQLISLHRYVSAIWASGVNFTPQEQR